MWHIVNDTDLIVEFGENLKFKNDRQFCELFLIERLDAQST